MDRLKKINWVRTGFSEIPENVENAIVAFCQKNEIMHIDIIKGRDLQKAIEDIIWDYGIETEFISLLVGYFNSQKELEKFIFDNRVINMIKTECWAKSLRFFSNIEETIKERKHKEMIRKKKNVFSKILVIKNTRFYDYS